MLKKGVPEWSSLWAALSPKSKSRDPLAGSPTNSSPEIQIGAETPPSPATVPPSIRMPPVLAPPKVKSEIRAPGSDPIQSEEISCQSQLLAELSKKDINLGELRRLASQGIPDGSGIRSTVWKLLLGYLPKDRGMWMEELNKKRSQYEAFKEDFLLNPTEITRILDESADLEDEKLDSEGKGLLPRSHIPCVEHPLSLGQTSVWNQFFQDTEIIEQIDRDVRRTHPDLHFFSGDSSMAKSNQACAEADAFFCFVELLSGFRDNFCQKLDNSVVGIRCTIGRLAELLKKYDGELWHHLEITSKVNPQFYAFRWITLLLTQEFNFADSLHIWDTLLSDPEGPQETLLRVCCAMLILVRKRLLAGDFAANLKLLQNYPSTNISHLLYVANKLRER